MFELVNPGVAQASQMYNPFFSPDGTQIGYYDLSLAAGEPTLKRISTQGGPPSTITSLQGSALGGATWGEDGTIVYANSDSDSGLWRVRSTGGEPDSYRALISSPSNEYAARPSPGGAWVSFGSDESGQFESYVQLLADGSGREPITIGGSTAPFWTSGSQYLIYAGFEDNDASLRNMMRLPVSISAGASGSITFGEPETLFPFDYYYEVDARSQFDMTADGERFIVISAAAGNIYDGRMILVQNWFEELERLVPTD